ncbi:cold-shock protein [Paenibacillus flagellatus]|uniref:Cold-shock protein n=1 Tax=Paenibacillus flagellatus TaxID=2211139 RepID=A0A2V5KBR0_9BACL|nr:cold-shock protein [Paenibacillus flagellatus]PYI51330.1 hypothetical protein DLM86_25220 [Paenibacillus flagellatus]
MYYSRKRLEDIPQEVTAIWSCIREGCNGWIRDNFAFAEVPTCHLCQSPMKKSMSELPVLVNTREDQKFLKKGIPIEKE